MTSTPTTLTAVAGTVLTAAEWNTNNRDVENFLMNSPICQCRQTVAQSIPTGTQTALNLDSEDVDSSGMHSTSSNTSRFTAVYAGWYRYSGKASFAANTTGRRGAGWQLNGAQINAALSAGPATAASIASPNAPTILIFQNTGDYVQLMGLQESGAALNTTIGASDQPFGMCCWESN